MLSGYPTSDSDKGLYVTVWRGASLYLYVSPSEAHCFRWVHPHNASFCRHKSPLQLSFSLIPTFDVDSTWYVLFKNPFLILVKSRVPIGCLWLALTFHTEVDCIQTLLLLFLYSQFLLMIIVCFILFSILIWSRKDGKNQKGWMIPKSKNFQTQEYQCT